MSQYNLFNKKKNWQYDFHKKALLPWISATLSSHLLFFKLVYKTEVPLRCQFIPKTNLVWCFLYLPPQSIWDCLHKEQFYWSFAKLYNGNVCQCSNKSGDCQDEWTYLSSPLLQKFFKNPTQNHWADWNQKEKQGHSVFSFFLCFTKLLWVVLIKNVIVLLCVQLSFLNLKGTVVFKGIWLNYPGTSLGKLCLICGPITVMNKTPQRRFPNWISSVATSRIQPH